ncbi:MAG: hypothetical protein J6M62_02615 [Selenomonadaceae bacterium]|nr:hypothetical protein [Selenomonadaceae bacterium]MBP3723819.1 hypothetical protein [Selenomonadaceae bacterium]
MSIWDKHGSAELTIVTKGDKEIKFDTSRKIAFDIVKNQKTMGVHIVEDSAEIIAVNYNDISVVRAVALDKHEAYMKKSEENAKTRKPIYIPPDITFV